MLLTVCAQKLKKYRARTTCSSHIWLVILLCSTLICCSVCNAAAESFSTELKPDKAKLTDYPIYARGWNAPLTSWAMEVEAGDLGGGTWIFNAYNNKSSSTDRGIATLVHQFPQPLNLINATVDFGVSFDATLERQVATFSLSMVDSKGRRYRLETTTGTDKTQFQLGPFTATTFTQGRVAFDISQVHSIELTIVGRNTTAVVSGTLFIDDFHLQVDRRFSENFENSIRPQTMNPENIRVLLYTDDDTSQYDVLHRHSVSGRALAITPVWQYQESALVSSSLWDKPTNFTGVKITQEFSLPLLALGSSMALALEIIDIRGDYAIVQLASLADEKVAGWKSLTVDTDKLAKQVDLKHVQEVRIWLKRNSADGYLGEFKLLPAVFSY